MGLGEQISRWRSAVCALVARTLAWISLIALAIYAAGAIVNDRAHITQYVSWVPAPAAMIGVLLLLAASRVLAACARPAKKKGPTLNDGRRARTIARWALAAAVVIAGATTWRLYRLALPTQDGPRHRTLRVVHFNANEPRMPGFIDMVLMHDPDLIVITNPPVDVSWNELAERLTGGRGSPASMARSGRLVVVSRDPILAWGGGPLGVSVPQEQHVRPMPGLGWLPARLRPEWWPRVVPGDTGWGMFIRLDSRERLGREIVAWCVDLPSEPRLWRWRALHEAGSSIAAWDGMTFARTSDGGQTPVPSPEGGGFPQADVVVGDFNTPRGAASLQRFMHAARQPPMEHAFDQGGVGFAGTFPRRVPLFHIDHAFIGPGLAALAYSVVDPGAGRHRMQVFAVGVPGAH